MEFDADAFVSYAHLDNVELVEGSKGWVANLQRALAIRVTQRLGKESQIWWDKKLQGNDVFDQTLIDRLQRVATLVAVVSPRYVKSEWTLREVAEFCKAAGEHGGLQVQDKARLFKVLKTAVPLEEQPPQLQSMLGYEFFKVDPSTGRVREFNEIFGPEAQQDFWLKLDDLVHDVCGLLKLLDSDEKQPDSPTERSAVYLAATTTDLRDEREAIQRHLEQHGHTVLPDRPLPLAVAELEAAVRGYLSRCRLAIHLVGHTYSLVPEGKTRSLLEIQNELTIERAQSGSLRRLVWIPPGLDVQDDRQRQVLTALRSDPRIQEGADVLETPLEALITLIGAWLDKKDEPAPPTAAGDGPTPPHLYLIYDRRDADAIAPWADFLFKQGFEIIRPTFDGEEAEMRADHDENLRTCDGVVIFYGSGNESWLRRKLREVNKSVGYGRTKAKPPVGLCLIAPRTADKERFQTHEATLVPQWDGLAGEAWGVFTSRLKGEPRRGDAADTPA